jgi:hypothetical protein
MEFTGEGDFRSSMTIKVYTKENFTSGMNDPKEGGKVLGTRSISVSGTTE